jgi:hypothetical protein
MYGNNVPPSTNPRNHGRKFTKLLRELSDDEGDWEPTSTSPADPQKPWRAGFRLYLDTLDHLNGMTIVQWWGVCVLRSPILSFALTASDINLKMNAHRYPVWASLAADFLSIMASSVSSERAFSSAGITISKRRNRLHADIVEALQVLKCMFHHGLIFREQESSLTEGGDDEVGSDGWNEIVADIDSEGDSN